MTVSNVILYYFYTEIIKGKGKTLKGITLRPKSMLQTLGSYAVFHKKGTLCANQPKDNGPATISFVVHRQTGYIVKVPLSRLA